MQKLKLFLILPLRDGLIGFAAFIIIISSIRLLANAIFSSEAALDQTSDLIFISSIGFLLTFTIRFVTNIQNGEENNSDSKSE
ncbi:MAG: hypothetical protein K8F36_10735 [Melioribacteraceae bacterium]|nr:hypothetical protein [Melioribacteraceae bacterium]